MAVSHHHPLTALLLFVPAASIGVAMALFIAPGFLGQMVYTFCKIWMFVLPGVWFFGVEKGKLKLSFPENREIITGMVWGAVMFATIIMAYELFGQQWIDPEEAQAKAQEVGLRSPQIYLAGAAYFTLINALIEEYVWRWFVGRQWEKLVPGVRAIFLSAVCFTLHHIIALAAYTDWRTVILGALGVFLAGLIWSWNYSTYRSIASSSLSHILADAAIAIVGWRVLFC